MSKQVFTLDDLAGVVGLLSSVPEEHFKDFTPSAKALYWKCVDSVKVTGVDKDDYDTIEVHLLFDEDSLSQHPKVSV